MEQPLDLTPDGRGESSRFAAVSWRDFSAHEAWDHLPARAAEPNPFAERWFVMSGLEAFDEAGEVMLASLEVDGELVGVLPLARYRSYARYPFPHIATWFHPNAFCAAPLVAAGHEHAFWRELLGWADAHPGLALFLHLSHLPEHGPLYAALRDVVASQARAAAIVHRMERAMLASDLSADDYFAGSLSTKKRKELRRQARRLDEEGTVRFDRQTGSDGLDTWTEQFLALEAAGWKGQEGSALASAPDTIEFFRKALDGAARHDRLERLAFYLDDQPIAMLASFITAPGAYSFKTAFDEDYARFSPGVLLQRENLALLDRNEVDWCDSCAAADHPMIDHIWREKRSIVRVSLAIGGAPRRLLANLILRAETGAFAKGL
ncbi:GNAT family N-acetyltransferase [Tsuneonella mangrovi]|uniref:GNAT family N-acetyltransferase n=1 Tax=Tsuneonella mangrovi TaxID=1982042 RepID=UPI001F0A52F4|nr:GNAT family N-acetyltransferase [Tsuneonella mangrovi]